MNLLFGLIAGVLGYCVSLLVFNNVISVLIGLLIGLVVAFGSDRFVRR